jgi:DNA polymerase-4
VTDRADEIETTALYLADHLLNGPRGLFEEGISIRLIGVGVSRLSQKQMQQMDLFAWAEQNEEDRKKLAMEDHKRRAQEEKEKAEKARQARLNSMMEQINGKFGSGTVRKGDTGTDLQQNCP